MHFRTIYLTILFLLLILPENILSFEEANINVAEKAFEEKFKKITLNPDEINIYRIYDQHTKICSPIGGLTGDWKQIAKENIQQFNALSPTIEELKKFASGPHEGYFSYSYGLPIEKYNGIDGFSKYNFYFISSEVVSEIRIRIKGTVRYKGNQYRASSGWLLFDCPSEDDGFVLITKKKLAFKIQPLPEEKLKFFDREYMSGCDKKNINGKLIDAAPPLQFVIITYKIYLDPSVRNDCNLKKNATHMDLLRVGKEYELLQHFTLYFPGD